MLQIPKIHSLTYITSPSICKAADVIKATRDDGTDVCRQAPLSLAVAAVVQLIRQVPRSVPWEGS